MELIEPGPPEMTIERGFSYIKKGEFQRAISAMDELIKSDPYLAQAYWGRALCIEYGAEEQDDAQKAIDDYSRSIVYSKEPSPLSYGRRGILYFKTGMYEEALSDLDTALMFDGCWAEALFYRGRTYIALERGGDDARLAVSDFSEALRNMSEPFAPAHFWRAQALRSLGREEEAAADYERAIEIDPEDVLALNALAYCSEHGIGKEKNMSRAEELYERAAELGFVVAQKNLAWFYGGGGENARLSAYWMRRAAELGDAEAQNLYALHRLYGKGTKQSFPRAAYYFGLSSSQGYLPAACNLADCYEQGLGVEKDSLRALEIYMHAAESGSVSALYNVGRYYYFGIGVPEDNDKAFEILKPLADSGHAGAQDIVGMCYENGYGVERDATLAGKYFRLAYKQGHANAATHLAVRYRFGRGVKKNLATAIKLYKQAGETGSPYAWYALGRLYFEDKCDYEKAEQAFRTAAAAGWENVSVWLARSLMYGKSPKADAAEAYSLLQRAADEEEDKLTAVIFMAEFDFFGYCGWQVNHEAAVRRVEDLLATGGPEADGVPCAYYFLAKAYELGLGVHRDERKALELYMKAGDAGSASGGCRCFAAGMAHVFYKGIGRETDKEAAERIIEDEWQNHAENLNNEVRLLLLWSRLCANEEHERGRLIRLAKDLIKEEPHDAVAAYMLYILHKDFDDADKYLRKLRNILKTASPYYRFMVERALASPAEQPAYPVLCAETLDEYKAAAG